MSDAEAWGKTELAQLSDALAAEKARGEALALTLRAIAQEWEDNGAAGPASDLRTILRDHEAGS